MSGQIWLWIAFWGMVLGAIAIAFVSLKGQDRPSPSGAIHILVPITAATLYLLMALGEGAVAVDGGTRLTFFARYIDWSITTPLLLLGLAYTALGNLKAWGALIGSMIGADVLMIVTGLFADLSPSGSLAKLAWYLVSCGAFLAVYYVLWIPLMRGARARGAQEAKVYTRNASILSVLWLIYPVVFLVGTEGLSIVALGVELAAFAILDLLAKVAYGLLASVEHKTELA